jgi:hypothetical protein
VCAVGAMSEGRGQGRMGSVVSLVSVTIQYNTY